MPFLDNLGELLRINRIFEPDRMIGNDMPSQGGITGNLPRDRSIRFGSQEPPEPMSARNTLDDLYQPQSEMQDRYRQLVDEFPIRQKPSFARKLTASIAGGERGKEILNEPYDQAMADYKTKADIIGGAAATESRFNRDMANQALSQARIEIQQQQANTAALKNQQIYETTLAKMEAAAVQANAKLELAVQKLQLDSENRTNQLTFKQAELEAEKAQFAAQMARKDLEIANLQSERLRQDEARRRGLDVRERQQEFAEEPTTEEIEYRDAQGNVVESGTRTRGATSRVQPQLTKPPANTVPMIGKDGQTYYIPRDKVEQARKDGFRHPSRRQREQ